ncbi:flagellar basal body-associated FliL family protein [Dehalobacter sp. DCM]|uniref:flagellar basal body-associated FliL family protein n=1 Tax=Dehalobacter sp. DCM TaxID=2907827 RepID=UPI003081E911|nr:flagellar basal body-associated FliL family protein [Dehalobacter sp. DCM]
MKIKINKKIISYILILVIGIGVGAGGMLMKDKFLPNTGQDTAESHESTKDEIGPLVELSEFTINLDGGGIVKTKVVLEGVDKKSSEEIEEKAAFLEDKVIAVMGSKDLEDMRTANREDLKKELVTELNKICDDQIQDVLFISFMYD